MSIENKVAWITASGDGIGKACALLFARQGARLALCDVNEEALAATKREARALGAEVLAIPYDADQTAEIKKVFDALIERYGRVDILVNNAGIAGPVSPIFEVEVEEWDRTLEVNLRGSFYCIKLAAPYMIKQGGGKIVNMASTSGKSPLLNRSPYCASKMGMIGLTRVAALELGKYGITVNAVCPSNVAGPRLDFVFENLAKAKGVSPQEILKQNLAETPLPHLTSPEDVAEAVLFFSDHEKSRSVTGEDFNVSCGKIMY